ncbi:hypothetical protein JKP88DRAFT_242632 [Tribonema minus]|uniref:Uncharacterized protein n=1 Tax=Tribonema minus TaxID=303371 RepID=A0A835ZE26_9STRA|nr:hypothetical protein JKP88DRAFT_242632 [Tribonema minus]
MPADGKYPRTVCVRSGDRVSGSHDQFLVSMPKLSDGPWTCDCQGTFLTANGISELQVRGGSLSSCQSTSLNSNWTTAVIYINNVPTMRNSIYFSSTPPLQLEFRHVVVSTGAVTTNMAAHSFIMNFLPYDPTK